MNKKSKIPYFLALFFLVVVTVNIGYIVISKKSFNGVATQNSYNKGLKYNQTLAKKKDQEKLKWKINIKISQAGKNQKDIKIFVKDKDNNNIENAKVNVRFIRPTYEGIDFNADFDQQKNTNFYQKLVTFPALGVWDFEISLTKDNDNYKTKKRFVIHNL